VSYHDPQARDAEYLPAATADRTHGHLYVAFQGQLLGNPRVLFTKSSDQGTTWSAPVPASDNPEGVSVFNPAIAVSPDGQRVTIVFYDKRVDPTQPTLVDLFLAQSFDGGVTWQPNLRLTRISSDLTLAPLTSDGYMLGDYIGVAESTTPTIPAVAAYIDTRTGSPDPFVVRAGLAPQLDFTSWRAARFSAAATADPKQGSPGADPDGDGVVNAMEYALGLQPFVPDRATFTPLAGLTGDGTTLSVRYRRLAGAADLTFAWEESSGLSEWLPASPSNETVSPAADDLTALVTTTFGPTLDTRGFRRLRVRLTGVP
jgi:hypothetical protein